MCSQNVSHPAGNMPATWYVWFRVDSDGIRPLLVRQSGFGHLLVNLDSYVLYTTMNNNTS